MKKIVLEKTASGKTVENAKNYLKVLEKDKIFGSIRFNEITEQIEIEFEGKTIEYDGIYESPVKVYFSEKYDLYRADMLRDCISNIAMKNSYNPIKEKIESFVWDGKPRLSTWLIDNLNCDDNEYTRAVCEIVMSGLIRRIYEPGCKFDYVLVLVSKKQGQFKSSFINLLGLGNTSEILALRKDKETQEKIVKSTIVELPEFACINPKTEDFVKGFISSTSDRFRPAYGRTAKTYKRQNIFIATTNREKFVSDKTGARRYLPVYPQPDVHYLSSHIDEVKEYINQLYAEAYQKVIVEKCENVATYIPEHLEKIFTAEQNKIRTDGSERELIIDYLDKYDGKKLCAIQVCVEALGLDINDIDKSTSAKVNKIIDETGQWQKCNSTNFGIYGKHRGFKRV